MSPYAKIENDTFSWKIEKFSEYEQKYVSQIFTSRTLNDSQWYLDLYIFEYGPEAMSKFLNIYLNKCEDENKKNFSGQIDFTITILASDISYNISRKSISNMFPKAKNFNGFPRIVNMERLYAKSHLYLPNDTLTVECYIEGKFEDPPSAIVHENEMPENLNDKIENLGNDLLSLYLDSKFCDIKIVTADRVFSVHKTVICARSPVFRAMFENDSKEKNTSVIDIPDIDSATINQMLMYMYSDVAENMDFNEAEKLYTAADKYEILPLKKHCSAALKSIISEENLGDIYTLADMHHDSDLKTAVEGYVFIYTKKVFKSSDWEKFMQLNPPLSGELMHKVWIKLLED